MHKHIMTGKKKEYPIKSLLREVYRLL